MRSLVALCIMVVAGFAFGAAVTPQTPSAFNSETLQEFTRKAPKQVLSVPYASLDPAGHAIYGPLRFRLSTLQGLSYLKTAVPAIFQVDPASGYSDRILGGTKADVGDFPWQVAILNATWGTLVCGGSHIGNGWIVTAAHCVVDARGERVRKEHLMILSGSVSLIKGGQRTKLVDDPLVHEQYDAATNLNDIALLRTEGGISPLVRLASPPMEAQLVTERTQLMVSGWGNTTEDGRISTELLKVVVPVVSPRVCAAKYPGLMEQRQVCAGDSGRDSCQGDSGGPLSGRDGNETVLVGVVSYGKGCGRPGYPGVYTRSGAFVGWVKAASGI